MDPAQAWHTLITHSRDMSVTLGEVTVRVVTGDEEWRVVTRRDGEVVEKATGTHTADLLVYLTHLAGKSADAVDLAQGEPVSAAAADGIWFATSEWSVSFSTPDGRRRMRIANEQGIAEAKALLYSMTGVGGPRGGPIAGSVG